MPPRQSILAAYEHGLKNLADELIAENEPSDEERAHLLLVVRMTQSLVKAYDSYQLKHAFVLNANKVTSQGAGKEERPILNLTLRSLVDNNLMTPWHARFLNNSLGLRRTVLITGGENTGKSTLLNALVDLLPTDHRVVAIDGSEEGLPRLADRSFTVQLQAKRGTPARAGTFRKAADMKPSWVVVGELTRREGPVFLETLVAGSSGLATIQTPEPVAALTDWLSMRKAAGEYLKQLNPVICHLHRNKKGYPRVQKILEVTVEDGSVIATPRNPGN